MSDDSDGDAGPYPGNQMNEDLKYRTAELRFVKSVVLLFCVYLCIQCPIKGKKGLFMRP